MHGEIIAIGDELMTGRVINTTSGFAARKLFDCGYAIKAMHTIGDEPLLIGELLNRALGRADFLIVTGGLGSTSDDLTNEAVIAALDRPGKVNDQVLATIRRRHPDTPDGVNLEKLAWLPDGAEVFDTSSRMAGYLLIHRDKPIFFLPGVPPQMEQLMVDHVLPRLNRIAIDQHPPALQLVLRTFGLSEIEVNTRLLALEQLAQTRIGYYPVGCEVHVSLTVTDGDAVAAADRFAGTEEQIRSLLGDCVYGAGEQTMAGAVGELLLARDRFLAVAESCTGGLISSKITEVPGSSRWYLGGVTAYANTVKQRLLDIDADLLASCGAVSSQVAWAMAARLADRLKADIGLSTTGIAGPDGGSEAKPVGTVHIGLFHQGKVKDHLFHFRGTRKQIQEITATTALDLVRRALLHPA